MEPVESLSPEWLTAASKAPLGSREASAQQTAIARASSPTHPSPSRLFKVAGSGAPLAASSRAVVTACLVLLPAGAKAADQVRMAAVG